MSPEASIDLHTGNNALPKQVIVFTKDSSPLNVTLPNNMSLLILGTSKKAYKTIHYKDTVYAHSLESALVETAPLMYTSNPISIQLAIKSADFSELSQAVLTTKNVSSGNRIIAGLHALGMKQESRNLETIMKGAGFEVGKKTNPFEKVMIPLGARRGESSASVRIRILWEQMRQTISSVFSDFKPPFNFIKQDLNETVAMMDDLYVSDAYNSLSIEGYKVTQELIKKVAKGDWSPETQVQDKEQKDALAARGYFDAFNKIKQLIVEAHQAEDDLDLEFLIGIGLTEWYTALFQPCVTAGIIQRTDLAGYRKGPIYIRTSMHVPHASEKLMDCMDTLKELIAEEEQYIVKAILGHLLLGYIHPFPDGNGRTARFLMNFILVIGGYPWTIIKHKNRIQYLASLESASVGGNIQPFSEFIKSSMQSVLED